MKVLYMCVITYADKMISCKTAQNDTTKMLSFLPESHSIVM